MDPEQKIAVEREAMAHYLSSAARRAEQWLEARAAGGSTVAIDARLAEDIRTFRAAERRMRRAEKKLRS